MKKILLFAFLVLPLINYATNYTKNISGFYDYIGEPVSDDIVWNFSQLQSSDINRPNNIFAENLIEFQTLGLYKYGYYSSRQCGSGDTYAPLMWNGGNSMVNGVSTANNAITNAYDFPAIYFPKSQYGIRYIVIEGWGHENPAPLIFMKKDANGDWVDIKTVSLKKNTYTKDTIVINDPNVKEVMFHRTNTNTAYQFITKLTYVVIPAPEYAYNETSKRYDYIGEPLEETLVVDFSQLPPYVSAYHTISNPNDSHVDTLLGFGNVGLYKWCYYATKTVESVTYAPLLWNNGYSDIDNARVKNSDAALTLKPAIYLPTMKNGISKIIVEGWTNGSGKNKQVYLIGKDATGSWKKVNEIDPSISTNEITLKGDTYTQETLEINSHQIKTVAIYRSTTEYQFITKITIIPMEGLPEVEIDENENNEPILTDYKDQTVNLIVNRNLKAGVYNTFCLPGEVSGSAFKTAIGDPDCEIRWFDNAAIEGNSLNLTFNVTSKIQAGFPYLVKPSKDIEDPILLENVEIKYTTGRNIARPNNDNALVKFFSTLSPMELNASENYLVLSADNTLYFVDEAVTMPGMRGYFMLYNEAARAVKANKMPMRANFPPPSSPTDIEPIKDNKQCYKYIENGQLIIRRDGIKYTIDGRIIK